MNYNYKNEFIITILGGVIAAGKGFNYALSNR